MSYSRSYRGNASKNLYAPIATKNAPMHEIQGLYESLALNICQEK